ncbi:ectoine synthase [Marinococcus luteus]|uniref:L-ectoine synthase n=1 Tax=Marinococcus luteus TaxID=1122204 RepID=A0A1H2X869_9BACI|nr:ectoine synthase [Marinococcus luteus]SDW89112.1 ectoine synthase [Marinococcus luteus]
MKVIKLEDLLGTEREVDDGNWVSRRFIMKDDNMGYSVNDTIIRAGTETHIWYQNHLETVYCIEGDGEIETLSDNKVYQLEPGVLYALDQNDEHLLRGGSKDMRMVCVFNPPLSGREVHDENGVYPADLD